MKNDTNTRIGRVLMILILGVILTAGMIYGLIQNLKPETMEVHIDKEIVVGEYHFEEGRFIAIVGDENRDLQTGAGVVEFQYKNDFYRIEIPTKAMVTVVYVNSASLFTHETEINYKTDRFGEDLRLSRIFKKTDPDD